MFSWKVAAFTPGFARKRNTIRSSSPSARMRKKDVTATALYHRSRTSTATGVAGWSSQAPAVPAARSPAVRPSAVSHFLRDGMEIILTPRARCARQPRAQGLSVLVEGADLIRPQVTVRRVHAAREAIKQEPLKTGRIPRERSALGETPGRDVGIRRGAQHASPHAAL